MQNAEKCVIAPATGKIQLIAARIPSSILRVKTNGLAGNKDKRPVKILAKLAIIAFKIAITIQHRPSIF